MAFPDVNKPALQNIILRFLAFFEYIVYTSQFTMKIWYFNILQLVSYFIIIYNVTRQVFYVSCQSDVFRIFLLFTNYDNYTL
jgi:hypothetical protein